MIKKFIAILLLCLPLGGTAIAQRLEPEAYQSMLPRNVQYELAPSFLFTQDEDISGLTFFDAKYVSVSKKIMERWVAAAFKKVERVYVSELHDCDDLAWEMLVFLRREAMHAHPKLEYGLLAGMAAVKINTPIPELGITFTGEHAVVLIRVYNGDTQEGTWWVIEPGTGKGTKLAEELFDGRLELKGGWF